MNLSDFGRRFHAYSGITHLMDDLAEGLAQPGTIMLGGGNPASIPEVSAVFSTVLDQLRDSGKLISTLANYDSPQGKASFLETLAEFFQQQYGWNISSRNIALTHGSQSSFFILFNSFAGRSRGVDKRVLIPLVPEYIGYCDVGIDPDLMISQQAKIQQLDDGFFKYQVDFENLRVAYGTPFPKIIFDDVNPLWNENCIVCMSLSKLGLPGARTGIVIANEEVIQYFSNMTAITSLAPAGIGAEIVNQLILDEALLPLCHDVIRPFYQNRAELAVTLLRQAIGDSRLHIHKPEGSMFLWLWLEGLGIDTSELYQRLKRKGLLVVPGKYFFPGQGDEAGEHAESCVRMNYVQSEQELAKGIDILARELKRCW